MHRRCVGVFLGVSTVVAGLGCTQKGGGLLPSAAGTASPMTWDSTAALPKTVVIVDTRTGENVFEINIPMGQQLSVQFFEHKDPQEHPKAPDIMKYTLHPLGRWVGYLDQSVPVPHSWNRRVDVFLQSQEAYTAPDPARKVVPFGVPMPEKGAAVSEPVAVPMPEPAAEPKAETTAEPAVEPATEPTIEPAEEPAAEPKAQPAAAALSESAEETDPAAVPKAKAAPEAVLALPTSPPVQGIRLTPTSTMIWTDTGKTRRVSVADMRTGKDVFELDVPEGHDLVMHFYEMWTPPGSDNDVEGMHWEIVPAGSTVDVPTHHATVPAESHRRVTEQAAETPATKGPPVTEPALPEQTAEPESAVNEPPATPIDLLDDDETTAEPESEDSPAY